MQHNRRLYLVERNDEAVKLELVFFPFPATAKRPTLPEFSLTVDSLTDIMVNKTLFAYQRNEPKDVFDLYLYLTGKPEYTLPRLIYLVEKKFGVAIEPSLLLAKINQLADDLNNLQPLLVAPRPNLAQEAKGFFQEIFNQLAKEKIK